ncbi:E3 SUMO-protein ligase pli1 [Coemansia sp. RSA 2399]|nr:E3 SUMO-protein ligase pli1 [Coemansia sp. RSA 2399]
MCTYTRAANATTEVPKRPICVEYPTKLAVYVNAKPISAIDVHKATTVRHPLNLSEHLNKVTNQPNNISITYSTHGRWVSSLILTKELTFQTISSEIRKTNFVTAESVRQKFFRTNLGGDDDDDLISTGALVSLKCPLGLCRINTPTRSKYCQHSQCFDCETFLQLNKRGSTWKCPVCSVAVKSWRELIVDGYFEGILQGTSQNDDQVYIESNGDWKKKDVAETTDVDAREPSSRTKSRPLEVSLIDDSATSDNDGPSRQSTSRNKRRRTEVIDLTLDSDSENDTDGPNAIPVEQENTVSQGFASKRISNYEKTPPAYSTLGTDIGSVFSCFNDSNSAADTDHDYCHCSCYSQYATSFDYGRGCGCYGGCCCCFR